MFPRYPTMSKYLMLMNYGGKVTKRECFLCASVSIYQLRIQMSVPPIKFGDLYEDWSHYHKGPQYSVDIVAAIAFVEGQWYIIRQSRSNRSVDFQMTMEIQVYTCLSNVLQLWEKSEWWRTKNNTNYYNSVQKQWLIWKRKIHAFTKP